MITHGYIITIPWSSYGMLLLPSISFISNYAYFIHFLIHGLSCFSVDEKERKAGNDPEKELADSGFMDYTRP